jgi:hypothetical protein
MDEKESLNHTKWKCKSHVAFISHFFRLALSPALLESPVRWLVTPGQTPTVLKDSQPEDNSPRQGQTAKQTHFVVSH